VVTLPFEVTVSATPTLIFEVNSDSEVKKKPLGIATILLDEFVEEAMHAVGGKGTPVMQQPFIVTCLYCSTIHACVFFSCIHA
jgi:hypothetical protein